MKCHGRYPSWFNWLLYSSSSLPMHQCSTLFQRPPNLTFWLQIKVSELYPGSPKQNTGGRVGGWCAWAPCWGGDFGLRPAAKAIGYGWVALLLFTAIARSLTVTWFKSDTESTVIFPSTSILTNKDAHHWLCTFRMLQTQWLMEIFWSAVNPNMNPESIVYTLKEFLRPLHQSATWAQHTHTFTSFVREVLDLPLCKHATHVSTRKSIPV